MLFFKKAILIISLFLTFLCAKTLEEKAFEAYKQHKFNLAFALYAQAAKEQNIKATFMLGLFFEKGVGTQKNIQKAIKLYQLTIKAALLQAKNGNKKELKVALLAAKRLYYLTKKKKYKILLEKLQNLLTKKENVLNQSYEDYIAMCPAAKIIPLQDAEGIETFNCELFKQFPQRMKEFMHLRSKRFRALEQNNKKVITAIDEKLKIVLLPILKYIEQETFDCYVNANYYYDVKSCDYDYLKKTDKLLFKNRAQILERKMKNVSIKDYKLDPFQKEELVNKLIEKFSNKTYEKEVFKVVRLY